MLITLFILTRINLHTKMDGNIQVAPIHVEAKELHFNMVYM
jgi:hypothetical protein